MHIGSTLPYLCISAAELVTPRHENIIRPIKPTARRNRVRKMKAKMDREGGNRAEAAFQLTSPLGNNMMSWTVRSAPRS